MIAAKVFSDSTLTKERKNQEYEANLLSILTPRYMRLREVEVRVLVNALGVLRGEGLTDTESYMFFHAGYQPPYESTENFRPTKITNSKDDRNIWLRDDTFRQSFAVTYNYAE